MALSVLREISQCIQATSFNSLMADEVTDSANREQVVVCIRWIDEDFEGYEDFVGLYKVKSTAADILVTVVKDVLLRHNLIVKGNAMTEPVTREEE